MPNLKGRAGVRKLPSNDICFAAVLGIPLAASFEGLAAARRITHRAAARPPRVDIPLANIGRVAHCTDASNACRFAESLFTAATCYAAISFGAAGDDSAGASPPELLHSSIDGRETAGGESSTTGAASFVVSATDPASGDASAGSRLSRSDSEGTTGEADALPTIPSLWS